MSLDPRLQQALDDALFAAAADPSHAALARAEILHDVVRQLYAAIRDAGADAEADSAAPAAAAVCDHLSRQLTARPARRGRHS